MLILAIALAVVFTACAVSNADIVLGVSAGVKKARAEGRSVSMIPFVGGVAGAASCIVVPIEAVHPFFWVPILLDIGTGFYLAAAIVLMTADFLQNRGQDRNSSAADPGFKELQRNITGCILGTACGDSIGLPVEALTKSRQHKLFPDLDGHHFLFGRGMTSDDTEHTCMLAQALIKSRCSPEPFIRDFAWRLRFWFLRLPGGIGRATLLAAIKLWIGFPPRASGIRSAGNGPAMRSALLGVCFGDDPPVLRQFVRAATRITHTHEAAESGALTVAIAAYCSTRGENTPELFLKRLSAVLDAGDAESLAIVQNVAKSVISGESTESFARQMGCERGISGYILHTVPAALHAWLRHPKDLRAGVLEVVRCGGDADTTGAITGAIIGAGVGPEGVPEDWLAGIVEWPCTIAWMKRSSSQLARTVHEVRRDLLQFPADASVLRVSALALLARNLVFLAIVIAHGLRRLLPPYG